MVSVIGEKLGGGVRATTRSLTSEVHVDVLVATREGVLNVDIPYRLYETGGGYTWTKIPGVTFGADDVTTYMVDPDPAKLWEFADDNAEADPELDAAARFESGETDWRTLWHVSADPDGEFAPFTVFGPREAVLEGAPDGDFFLHEVEAEVGVAWLVDTPGGDERGLDAMLDRIAVDLDLGPGPVGPAGREDFAARLAAGGIDFLRFCGDDGATDPGTFAAVDVSRISRLSVTPSADLVGGPRP